MPDRPPAGTRGMRAALYASGGFWLALALVMLIPGWLFAAVCFLGMALACAVLTALFR